MRKICWILLLMAGLMTAENRILVHGHRGARSMHPENTLVGFEYAIAAGADFLELDVAVTKDNIPVVSHDPILPESICSGPAGATRVIRHMSVAELKRWDCGSLQAEGFPQQHTSPGERVPTLDEVLALAGRGDFHFNIETKVPEEEGLAPEPDEFVRLIIEAVRKRDLSKRVMLQSFDFRTLQAAAKIAPEIPRAALFSKDERDFAVVAKEAKASIAAPNFKLVTPEKVKRAHDAGLTVVPWTANDPEVWEQLVAAGVDAIITDDPARLIAWLKKGRGQ